MNDLHKIDDEYYNKEGYKYDTDYTDIEERKGCSDRTVGLIVFFFILNIILFLLYKIFTIN